MRGQPKQSPSSRRLSTRSVQLSSRDPSRIEQPQRGTSSGISHHSCSTRVIAADGTSCRSCTLTLGLTRARPPTPMENAMRRTAFRIAFAGLFIGLGWTMGKAQTSLPDFEFTITAPAGRTVVECQRGCELLWLEPRNSPLAQHHSQFEFMCGGPDIRTCHSGRVGGWLKP